MLDRLARLGASLQDPGVRRLRSHGMYVWGGAGRGKSWLLDAFVRALPEHLTSRVHVHGFFDELQRGIQRHRADGDALDRAVAELTGGTRLLFFDEFHVHDAGGAVLLTRMLRRVIAGGAVVLATSNYEPRRLLPDPIWHHLMEPGIELIESELEVVELGGAIDYRRSAPERSHGFAGGSWIVDSARGSALTVATDGPVEAAATSRLTVGERSFAVDAAGPSALRMTFGQLCEAPTSAIEYLEWAERFGHWVLTDVPSFDRVGREAQQRFITVVDVLADADVRLDVHASVRFDDFAASASGRPDAFRMLSRLRLLRTVG